MWPRLRRERLSEWALGLQALLLGSAYAWQDRAGRLVLFTAIGVLGLWAWQYMFRRARAILDTPTSRVMSAAQGYVELEGRAEALSGSVLLSPMSSLPCLWYQYSLYRRVNDRWQLVEEGRSDRPFLLRDATGVCEIDPDGAEIHSEHTETRQVGDRRYTESLLLAGDRLYALGEFFTLSGVHQALDPRADLDALLTEWKEDGAGLRARFDLDGDDQISEQEWRLALDAARREVERSHQTIRAQPGRHHLRKPAHGRFYLLSNLPPPRLGRRYARWAWVHLASVLAALVALAWALRLPG